MISSYELGKHAWYGYYDTLTIYGTAYLNNFRFSNGKTTFTFNFKVESASGGGRYYNFYYKPEPSDADYTLDRVVIPATQGAVFTKDYTVTGPIIYCRVTVFTKITLSVNDAQSEDRNFAIDVYADEENPFLNITLSGSFANNNLKSVTTYTKPYPTATCKIVYKIGTKSETNSNPGATTTKTFDSSWYSGLPSSASGTLTVNATITYDGSTFKEITKTLAVTIPDSVKPSISALTVAERLSNVPASWGIYVQGYSAIKINSMTYAAGTGSTVSTITLKVGSMAAKSGTPSSWPVSDTITSSGTMTVTVTVKDARGRTASRSVSITVVAYSPPNFNSVVSERCNAQMVVDEEGNRFKITTSVSYSSCNGKNSITLTLESRVSTESAYGNAQTITPNATVLADRVISPDAAYNVRLTLRDQFNTAYHYDYVSTALYLIHFHNGGTGIAFGQKASSNDSFEVNFDAVFHKETMFTATDGHTVTIQQIIDALGL
jgi:hypothetical protein